MESFSLDDVRDSFSADMSAQIRALGAAARTLAESSALEWRPEQDGDLVTLVVARAASADDATELRSRLEAAPPPGTLVKTVRVTSAEAARLLQHD